MVVNEIRQHAIGSHVPSPKFDEILQLSCQHVCDQGSDEGSQSTLSTFHSFSDSIIKREEVISDPFED